MNEEIEKVIQLSDGKIRDRSEFGTKAIEFYLNYLLNTTTEREIIISAIHKLGQILDIDLPDLSKLRDYPESKF